MNATTLTSNAVSPAGFASEQKLSDATAFRWPARERIEAEIQAVLETRLSPEFSDWVDAYARVGNRDPFLWNWCRRAVEITTVPTVPDEVWDHICDTKTLGVMWDVMLDDLADQNGNPILLDRLLALPEGRTDFDATGLTPDERRYGEFTCDVWSEIRRRLASYPYFDEYADLLTFDYSQLCNVMRYSYLLNACPEMLNLAEHDLYTPHNMHIMVCSTMDLMVSESFDRLELGRLREVIWNAQCMGRIGNLVTTWERELGEGDFTSGVVVRAVALGDVSLSDLVSSPEDELRESIRAAGHEDFYLRRWQEHREFLLSDRCNLHSFDVRKLVAGLDRLICLHLGSRGQK